MDEAERAFLLLCVVQPEDRVEAVEQAAYLDDVLGVDRLPLELVEHARQPADLVLDLGMAPAQRAGRIGTTESR